MTQTEEWCRRESRFTRFRVSADIFALVVGTVVIAQRPTLREMVIQAQADVNVTITANSPAPVPFAQLLERTDHAVRATIGKSVSHLSEDGYDIYTTGSLRPTRGHESSSRRKNVEPCAASTTFAGSDNYFCQRRVSKGVSPTTWRHSVIVVGRSVAVSDVSAEAPAGA